MDFLTQAAKLRQETKRRVDAKEISGSELARKMGVSQPSISAFLNQDLDFSLRTLNRLLLAMDLSIEQLHDPEPRPLSQQRHIVPIVDRVVAIRQPRIPIVSTQRFIEMDISIPRRKSGDAVEPRRAWTRFVAINATRAQARFMNTFFAETDLLILDRHDDSFRSQDRDRRPIYAVAEREWISIGYLRQIGRQTQLHSHLNQADPLVLILPPQPHPTHRIVGRVCHILRNVFENRATLAP